MITQRPDTAHLYSRAVRLALFTVFYNIIEGIVSVRFGADDETLALFGFGIDSFIEVVSAVGVVHMLRRIQANGGESRDEFEQRALRITGASFYLLAAGLVATAVVNLCSGHTPLTTLWGVIVSLVSMAFMWWLIRAKTTVGTALASPAILADAACSRVCLRLSAVLLASSTATQLTGIGSLDALGALLIAGLTLREGREAFDTAKGMGCSCGCTCSGADNPDSQSAQGGAPLKPEP